MLLPGFLRGGVESILCSGANAFLNLWLWGLLRIWGFGSRMFCIEALKVGILVLGILQQHALGRLRRLLCLQEPHVVSATNQSPNLAHPSSEFEGRASVQVSP